MYIFQKVHIQKEHNNDEVCCPLSNVCNTPACFGIVSSFSPPWFVSVYVRLSSQQGECCADCKASGYNFNRKVQKLAA